MLLDTQTNFVKACVHRELNSISSKKKCPSIWVIHNYPATQTLYYSRLVQSPIQASCPPRFDDDRGHKGEVHFFRGMMIVLSFRKNNMGLKLIRILKASCTIVVFRKRTDVNRNSVHPQKKSGQKKKNLLQAKDSAVRTLPVRVCSPEGA